MYNLSNEGCYISKSKLPKESLETLKSELTVEPQFKMDIHDEQESFPIYKETNNRIYGPRYFIQKKYKNGTTTFDNKNSAIDITFKGTLREIQVPVVETALTAIKSVGGGILQLHTGFGKTTIALYMAAQLKCKTLIIVHKSNLLDQWYERIQQFTNANIGIIRQKKMDIEDKDIVIGMLQSISMIDYDPKIFKDFDLIICDECHHFASKIFSRALFKVTPKYTIGLSATPTRTDGLTKVIKWFLGDIVVKKERKGSNAVYVKMFNYKSDNKLFVEKKRYFKGTIKPDTVQMTNNITKVKERNIFISKIAHHIMNQDERKIIVLSGRVEHLKTLKKLTDQLITKDIEKGKCDLDEYRTSLYIGGMKEYALNDAAEADVIFASYSMAEEGLDIDGLNTLILATPKKKVVQSVGRILRKPIKKGDINPLVVDITDTMSCFQTWGEMHRMKYYKKSSYTITNHMGFNDKFVSIKEKMFLEKIITKDDYEDPEFDIRKKYITHYYGPATYEFEFDIDFDHFPKEMFEEQNLEKIFTINHDFDE